ncbi:glycosyltransferase family 4 protein [Klebsiella michiganensis]
MDIAMKKLCYFINSDWYFDLHWIDRAIAARDAGYEIHIISHFVDGKVLNKFKTFGFKCHNVPLDAQSFNALTFFRAFFASRKLIKEINPDLLHCITIKPCLIGGLLSRTNNRPVIVSFVGLGRVFSGDTGFLKLLRNITIMAYKYIASNKRSIFMFEHDKDRKKLAGFVGIDYQQTIVIDGAGINPEIYKYSLEQDRDVPVVLFASRMLWSKGLGDLIEAKKILEARNIHFTLNVAGILVENDKDAISLAVIQQWHKEGLINWLGHSSNVCDLIEESNIVALPSIYSEGVPRILLEASSVGRACIAYDVGGCDSLIINNDNGIIVKSNSPQELADKLEFLLANPKARVEMGIKGRQRVQDKFSSGMIISKTLKTYHDVVQG